MFVNLVPCLYIYFKFCYLQWMLGEYSQAYLRMLACPTGSLNSKYIFSSRQPAFLDPNIGDFCLMLAAKTTMKNAIGEQNAASLSRWAILMRATALSRCGLPVSSSDLFVFAKVLGFTIFLIF